MVENIKNIIITCLIVGIIILLFRGCGDSSIDKNWNLALQDSMKTYRDANGLLTSKISILEDVNKDRLYALNSSDTTIKLLQEKVKYYDKLIKKPGSSLTLVRTVTKFDTMVETTTTYDTVNTLDSFLIYPTYHFAVSDNWVQIKGHASVDSSNVDLETKHEFTVVLGDEGGLFKSKPVALITDSNPYTKVKDMRAFRIKGYKNKRFGIGLNVGFGMGYANHKVVATPYIGIGLNYNLIKF